MGNLTHRKNGLFFLELFGRQRGGEESGRLASALQYKPLEPRDYKGSFKGKCRVTLKGFGVIEGRFRVVVMILVS